MNPLYLFVWNYSFQGATLAIVFIEASWHLLDVEDLQFTQKQNKHKTKQKKNKLKKALRLREGGQLTQSFTASGSQNWD